MAADPEGLWSHPAHARQGQLEIGSLDDPAEARRAPAGAKIDVAAGDDIEGQAALAS
jgi:hypothetical protein